MHIRPRRCGDSEISIELLNYGKLAAGEELRIPPSEGFGVTRRSLGLDPSCDRDFAPSSLMGLRRFEVDFIDERAMTRGCLLVRAGPSRFGELAPLTLMRARFRPEDGERGQGRLYQQSAVWAVDFESWRRNPLALLALADAELEARPDLLNESDAARFQSRALRRRLNRSFAATVRAPTAAFMVDVLCNYAFRRQDCLVTFGDGCELRSEAEFLATAGYALQLLPDNYPRWRDISLLSGLRHTMPGLCLRYLPSYRDAGAEAA
jgi:hypothetical protein